MYIFNIENTIRNDGGNEGLREFMFENYYNQIGITKKDSYYSLKKAKKKND